MPNQADRFYDLFAWLYPVADLFLMRQKRALIAEINRYPAGDLLEIGVGNGSHLRLYKNHSITGIDISEAMLARARSREPVTAVLQRMNGEALRYKNDQFDYVVLSHVIAVAAHPEQLIGEAYRVLKKGGRLFILNHFTPANSLRHLDKAFNYCSAFFRFRSLFYPDSIGALKKFRQDKEIVLGRLSYFRILIFSRE